MTKLGDAIFLAMADQGWALAVHGGEVIAWSPRVDAAFRIPVDMFHLDELEGELRLILLVLMVEGHLAWPWPPDHREDVHGETPRYDW